MTVIPGIRYADCPGCGQEMDGTSCNVLVAPAGEFQDPTARLRKPYFTGAEYPVHCRDCNAPRGGVHHLGCLVERCGTCDEQAACCDCRVDDE